MSLLAYYHALLLANLSLKRLSPVFQIQLNKKTSNSKVCTIFTALFMAYKVTCLAYVVRLLKEIVNGNNTPRACQQRH